MARSARAVDFFRVWSAELAYILGLWWTDGCMYIKPSNTAHEVRIASNDRGHLALIGRIIGTNYDLRKVSPAGNTYTLIICSKELYLDLLELGGSPRKSRIIGLPPVPEQLLPHFVRGVIDGDGTLAWNGDRPIIQVYSGSTDFLDGLACAIERASGIPAPQRQTNRDNWLLKWSTIRAKCLAAWAYKINAGLALPRKAALATDILAWKPRKTPEKGTITEEMRRQFSAYLP